MTPSPTWEVYEIESPGEAGPCKIEAPSLGVAVEYFLAIHGMFGYNDLRVRLTKEKPDELRKDVEALIPCPEELASTLDQTHCLVKFLS